MENIEEGNDDTDSIEDAMTGLIVGVTMEDDMISCLISVSGDICSKCSAEGCEESSVQYDCTNLDDGKSSDGECVSLDPFIYPFLLDSVEDAAEDALSDFKDGIDDLYGIISDPFESEDIPSDLGGITPDNITFPRTSPAMRVITDKTV